MRFHLPLANPSVQLTRHAWSFSVFPLPKRAQPNYGRAQSSSKFVPKCGEEAAGRGGGG